MCDLRWADPYEEAPGKETAIDWTPNDVRGCSVIYGKRPILRFLRQNDVVAVVSE